MIRAKKVWNHMVFVLILYTNKMDHFCFFIRPNKKLHVFRVTLSYLNLVGNLEFFSGFLEKILFYAF